MWNYSDQNGKRHWEVTSLFYAFVKYGNEASQVSQLNFPWLLELNNQRQQHVEQISPHVISLNIHSIGMLPS